MESGDGAFSEALSGLAQNRLGNFVTFFGNLCDNRRRPSEFRFCQVPISEQSGGIAQGVDQQGLREGFGKAGRFSPPILGAGSGAQGLQGDPSGTPFVAEPMSHSIHSHPLTFCDPDGDGARASDNDDTIFARQRPCVSDNAIVVHEERDGKA
jgi:hypothetical protein